MHVRRFVTPLNPRTTLGYLCEVLRLYSGVLVTPLLVSLALREASYSLILILLAASAWAVGSWGRRLKEGEPLELKEALVVSALSYLAFSLLSAFLFLPRASFLDGWFESMSGFTTTGLSVMKPEALPVTLLFFRAYSQWVGGAGIVVLSLVVLLRPGMESLRLFSTESRESNLAGDVIRTARTVFGIYGALTGIGWVAYLAVGMAPFEALLHILATVSTGGFSPHSDSIGHFNSVLVSLPVLVFMLAGATRFPIYYVAFREGAGRLLEDLQVRSMMAILTVCGLLLALLAGWNAPLIYEQMFHTICALTTTGFSLSETSSWGPATQTLTLLFMIIGGCSGSTAGGLKLIRLIILAKLASWLLLRALLPREAALPLKLGGRLIEDREIREVAAYLVLYLGVMTFSTLVLVGHGFDLFESLYESTSALGTVGLTAGLTAAELPATAKLTLMLDMWAGRLEIVPLLITAYAAMPRMGGRT